MKIWCQWADLRIPPTFELDVRPIGELSSAELAEIDIYIPKYMGGAATLTPITQMTKLKWVQLLTAGYEDAIPHLRPGIQLFNARGVHDFSTAELTTAMVLAHLTGLPGYLSDMRSGYWRTSQRDSIYQKKIAIIGAGSVGGKIGEFLAPFNVEITFFARSARPGVRSISELNDAIGSFDVVILIVPLTKETRHLIGKEQLKLVRDGALLVNVARGGVVDTDALLAELKSGRISAALDVTDPEPLPSEHELWRLSNVLITPHVGGNSAAFEPQAKEFLFRQLTALAKGEAMSNQIEWES